MTAAHYGLELEIGSDFEFSFIWKIDDVAVDIDGWTGIWQVRRSNQPTSEVIVSCRTTAPDATEGTVTCADENDGEVIISLPATKHTGLVYGWYQHELVLYEGDGTPIRKLEGPIFFTSNLSDISDLPGES